MDMEIQAILVEIKRVMKEKKITQTQVANELGMSTGNISHMMQGKVTLSVATLLQIAKVLDVDPASLIPSSEDGRPKQSFEDYVRSLIRDEASKDQPKD